MPEPRNANEALVLRFFRDVLNGANPPAAAQLLTPDFLVHHSGLPGGQGGMAEVAQLMAGFHAGFPDLHYDVQELVSHADRVVARWIATGTHSGPFMGVQPTGRHVTVPGTDEFRAADGRLAETWVCSDMLGLLAQIGGVPAAAGGAAPPAHALR